MKTKHGLHYAVDLDTRSVPGRIECVTVALDKVLIGPNDTIRVDLRDHPLYPKLAEYVRLNPPLPQKG